MIGEFLYALNPRDAQAVPIQLVNQHRVIAANMTFIQPSLDVPLDHIFILRQVYIQATAGSGQNATELSLMLAPSLGPVLYVFREFFAPTVVRTRDEIFDIPIPPLSRLMAAVLFDGNVNANTVTIAVHGVLIPRGNVGAGSLVLPP